jgi:RNase P subunit RPR2
MEDNTEKICEECEEGLYIETSVHDDWEGNLHCSECGHEVRRWIKKEDKKEDKMS